VPVDLGPAPARRDDRPVASDALQPVLPGV
jgi:hypothetical protein